MISPSFGQILVLVFFITLFTRSWAFSLERRSTSHFMLRTFERLDPVSHLLTSGPFSGFSGRIRPTTIRFVPFRFILSCLSVTVSSNSLSPLSAFARPIFLFSRTFVKPGFTIYAPTYCHSFRYVRIPTLSSWPFVLRVITLGTVLVHACCISY